MKLKAKLESWSVKPKHSLHRVLPSRYEFEVMPKPLGVILNKKTYRSVTNINNPTGVILQKTNLTRILKRDS